MPEIPEPGGGRVLTVPAASPTLAAMIAVVRQDLFDTDSQNYSIQDTELTSEINIVFQAWWEANSDRYQRLVGTAAWGNIAAQSAPGLTAASFLLNVLEWRELFFEGPTSTSPRYGVPLEIMSVQDVNLLQRQMGAGTPAYAAVARIQGNDVNNIGQWGLYLAPMPSLGGFVSALVRGSAYIFPVGGVTTDNLDCSNAEGLSIAHAAAAGLAQRQGMSDALIDSCWKLAGNQLQELLRNKKRSEPEARQKANAA